MSLFKLIEHSQGSYFVEGDMTFLTLNKINTFNFPSSAKEILIDLDKVLHADSAGLALIIEWIKQSKQQDTALKFKNVPHQLLTLAKLSDFNIENFLLS